jgi:hypothetical protein
MMSLSDELLKEIEIEDLEKYPELLDLAEIIGVENVVKIIKHHYGEFRIPKPSSFYQTVYPKWHKKKSKDVCEGKADAKEIDLTKIARDLGLTVRTLRGYLSDN